MVDVLPGEGGFGCIPGSHRPDYPWPEQFSRGERDAWRFPDEERSPGSSSGGWWAEELGVIAVAGEEPVRAGDCILFTEKVRASLRNLGGLAMALRYCPESREMLAQELHRRVDS